MLGFQRWRLLSQVSSLIGLAYSICEHKANTTVILKLFLLHVHCIAQRPSLPALQNFKTKEGEYVNILQMIGAGYSSFGICLLNDKDGGMLNTIRVSNNYKVEPVVEEIFNRWLMIRGSLSVSVWMYAHTKRI